MKLHLMNVISGQLKTSLRPGCADFMPPASYASLRVGPEGMEAELVVI